MAGEFNLRIICTYGAAAHGKGAIDAMSRFGVKNILRKGIVTHDFFFKNSSSMAEYLSSKNLQYYYNTIPVESLALARQNVGNPIELTGCMKQHLIISKPKEKIFCKEYLCDFNSCLQFDFENYTNKDAITMIMVMIMIQTVRKKLMRKLINPNKFLNLSLYHHLHLCPLVLQSSLFYFMQRTGKGDADIY